MSTEVNKIRSLFNKKYPNRSVEGLYRFRPNLILVSAPDKSVKDDADYSDPFYVYSEKDNSIISFSPMKDFEAFQKALRNPIKG